MITENDDSQDPACEEFHDEFMMSRWHEPTVMVTRTSVLQDPYPQGPHNERARRVRHEDVASLVPACSGARACHEQGRGDSTGSADLSIKIAELVEKCPPTTRHKVRNAVTTAEVKSPKTQTCDEQQRSGEWPS